MNLPIYKTIILTLLLGLAAPLFAQTSGAEKAEPARIAVLDFRTSGKTADLGESAAEILRNSLGENEEFSVVDRAATARAMKGRKVNRSGAVSRRQAIELGRKLGVKNIVTGSAERSGGTYTLNIRVMDATSGEVVSGKVITSPSPAICLDIAGSASKEGFLYRSITAAKPAAAPVKTPPPPQEPVVQAEPPKPAAAPVKAKFDPSKEVTYAQMLENPDDPDLNYAFARTQVRKGDLKGAAATLERMLMVNPDLHDIRLFYAMVLYRLDNLPESRREMEAVRKSKAPAALKAEASNYLKIIKKKQRMTTISGGLSAGAEYDSNRNASPASEKMLFLDTPFTLTGTSRQREDYSLLFLGSAEIRRILNSPKKHEVFASGAYYRADQDRVNNLNLQAYSFKAGGVYKAGRAQLKPALIYDRVLLDGERFLVNTGFSLRGEQILDRVHDLWLETRYTWQDHIAVPASAANPERKGGLYSLAAGAGRVLNPVMKLNADLGYSAKRADKDYNSYDSLTLGARHSWLLGKGAFLLSSVSAGRDTYKQADSAISARKRRDTVLRAGLVGGLPLPAVHRKLAKLKDLTLTLNLEHFRSDSNIINYTYTNNKAALLLNYKWALGF